MKRIQLLILAVALLLPASLQAQEIPCAGDGELSCGFSIESFEMQPAPEAFHFQSRIAQAGLAIGDATFAQIIVKMLDGADLLCMEQFANVRVKDSVLNLTIGQAMSCDFAGTVAERGPLAFQICLGGATNCLKPIPLATSPYAVKATYAVLAQEAQEAELSGQASYAHRAAADRDLLLRKRISTGYFDFETPGAGGPSLYGADSAQRYEDGGFLQWVPVRTPDDPRLHIQGRDAAGALTLLDELILLARRVLIPGDLTVDPPEDGEGLVVTRAGAHVTGDSDFGHMVTVHGPLTVDDGAQFIGDGVVGGQLTVQDGFTITGGGAQVTGDSDLSGALDLTGALDVGATLQVSGETTVSGAVTAQAASVTESVQVGGTLSANTLEGGEIAVSGLVTAPSASMTTDLSVGGLLRATGEWAVDGDVTFHDHVTFLGGSWAPDPGADMGYVQAPIEARAVAFAGPVAFDATATLGGDLDMAGHHLQNFRFETSADAPRACTTEIEGYFYLDSSDEAIFVCVDGVYEKLGGAECGNGNVQLTEGCDDGNLVDGDGCSRYCQIEPNCACEPNRQPSICAPVCGDTIITAPETCDDGNTNPNDGCSDTCQTLPNWTCTGEPSVCSGYCGSGVRGGTEECDDGNLVPGDGCTAGCEEEEGWDCSSGTCEPICGDGILTGDEECEDGNSDPRDGCRNCRNSLVVGEAGTSVTRWGFTVTCMWWDGDVCREAYLTPPLEGEPCSALQTDIRPILLVYTGTVAPNGTAALGFCSYAFGEELNDLSSVSATYSSAFTPQLQSLRGAEASWSSLVPTDWNSQRTCGIALPWLPQEDPYRYLRTNLYDVNNFLAITCPW